MATDVVVIGPSDSDPQALLTAAEKTQALFDEMDQLFSRFRDDSELSRVNAQAGRETTVSATFASLLGHALRGARRTDGLFDPTILQALVAAGYDRDFDDLRRTDRTAAGPGPAGAWQAVKIEGKRLRMPLEVALDFGGVAKGWTVDRAVERIEGLRWAVVNAGGDLRVIGVSPDDELLVGVEDPRDRRSEVARVLVAGGAIATSSVTRRSWGPGLHHLIDPRTWLPAETGVLQATVWAPTCAEAEILSKWALLSGPDALDAVPGLLVMEDGRVLHSIEAVEPADVTA